jgi:hypothetical protein
MSSTDIKATSKAETDPIFHNGGGPLKVPGFGHAVDLELDPVKRFRHGVNDFRNERLLVRELAMLAVMDNITDKPRWQEKVFDEAIVEKWRTEVTAMPLISPLAWDWCLRDLREKAVFLGDHGFITTLATGSVCAKGDGLIDANLQNELLAGVKPLLNVKEATKDWHPDSNEQVLNLVHPSLYPLVYGRTQVLQEGTVGLTDCVESCGKGTVAPQLTVGSKNPSIGWVTSRHNRIQDVRFSERFQWLPAEVKFKGDGPDVEFTSYINNLHPVQHGGLYSAISRVLSKIIPMWNQVLVKGYHGRVPERIKTWVNLASSTSISTHNNFICSMIFFCHHPVGQAFPEKDFWQA